ncbi:MAG: hypothetical protein OEZ06_31590 [Myxococcales bacterium]|nr:hypothetical protein [Myxococcales bacterium]
MASRFGLLGALLLAAVFGLGSCGQVTDPLGDKNTNWLKLCPQDESCGDEFQCLCGVCTLACEDTAQCGRVSSGSSCVRVGDPALQSSCEAQGVDDAAAVCAAECDGDDNCKRLLGPDASCAQGICVRSAQASVGEPGGDEGSGDDIARFAAFIAANSECDTVSDCMLIKPGCPVGCNVAVNAAFADEAQQLADSLRADDGSSCFYRCPPGATLACKGSRCEISEPEASRGTDGDAGI